MEGLDILGGCGDVGGRAKPKLAGPYSFTLRKNDGFGVDIPGPEIRKFQ